MEGQANGHAPALEEAQRLARTRLLKLYPELTGADPEVTLGEIAALHGVTYQTTLQWRQRSKPNYQGRGKLTPFPDPIPTHRAHEKRWRLSDVIRWSYEMAKWPESIGRPTTRTRV